MEGYKELLNSIRLHKHYKEVAESEFEYNKQLFGRNTKMNTRSTISSKPINRVVEDLRKYENMIFIEDERIKYLEEQKKLIDECIEQSDITVKVSKLRAMGMKQEDIAELVGICDRHVRRIEAKLRGI